MKKEVILKFSIEELNCIFRYLHLSKPELKCGYESEFATSIEKVAEGIKKFHEKVKKEMKFEN